jgi:S-adenosylmethionine:tRNA ribosyltransferase-isomerase
MNGKGPCTWLCLIGNKKKWKADEILEKELQGDKGTFRLRAVVENRADNEVRFSWDADLTFSEVIDLAGLTPIPPYLNRETVPEDKQRYQTIYSRKEGAVAAPTAGLHFSPETFKKISDKGLKTDFITLHVSAGTFRPVKTSDYREHPMHTERIIFTLENIRNLKQQEGKIIAVGTTSMRSLESLYWYGVKLITGKDEAFYIEKLFP